MKNTSELYGMVSSSAISDGESYLSNQKLHFPQQINTNSDTYEHESIDTDTTLPTTTTYTNFDKTKHTQKKEYSIVY